MMKREKEKHIASGKRGGLWLGIVCKTKEILSGRERRSTTVSKKKKRGGPATICPC